MGAGLEKIKEFFGKSGGAPAMGGANPSNDEALCESGDEAACERIRKRKEEEAKPKEKKKGEGTKALS